MSWSLCLHGKASTLAKQLPDRFKGVSYLTGREAELKEKAAAIVQETVEDISPDFLVKIDCSGSTSKSEKTTSHNLNISVQTLYSEPVE